MNEIKKNLKAVLNAGAICGVLMGLIESMLIFSAEFPLFEYTDFLLLSVLGVILNSILLIALGFFLSLPVTLYFTAGNKTSDVNSLRFLYIGILSTSAFFIAALFKWKREMLPWYSVNESSSPLTAYALIALASLFLGFLAAFVSKRCALQKFFKTKAIIPFIIIFLIISYTPFVNKDGKDQDLLNLNYPNIVLVTIDTLRADHLSCYGYKENTSPNIDQLVREGVLFKEVIAQEPQTGPSHSSIMTSKYPIVHGTIMNGSKLGQSETTLAEILLKKGFSTAAFVSAYVLDSIFGLDQGFEVYDDVFSRFKGIYKLVTYKILEKFSFYPSDDSVEIRADNTTQKVLKWLEKERRKPFFLWVHYFDPHSTYGPPPPFDVKFDPGYQGRFISEFNTDEHFGRMDFTESEIKHIKALYDGEIAFADFHIGRIFKKLKELGVYNNTVIIITADHGEDLYEHGVFDHQNYLYDTILRVPLIIKFKDSQYSNLIIKDQVQLIDIMPTILETLGMHKNLKGQGVSLMPLILGLNTNPNKEAYSETHSPAALKTKFSVRNTDWKFIHTVEGDEKELYNLFEDPLESKNLISREKERGNLEKKLKEWLNWSSKLSGSSSKLKVDKKIMEKIKSLGYYQNAK